MGRRVPNGDMLRIRVIRVEVGLAATATIKRR